MINKILIALVFALNLSGCESYFYNNERTLVKNTFACQNCNDTCEFELDNVPPRIWK